MKNETIIITGVHHTPALELINRLKKDSQTNWRLIYLSHSRTSDTHLSHTLNGLDILYYSLVTSKLDRRRRLTSVLLSPLNLIGFFQALILIIRFKPAVVVSFGGYVSFPVVLASWITGKPSIVHEQTLTPSLALKLSAPFATKIALSISSPALLSTLPQKKLVVTGNLLRQEIFHSAAASFSQLSPRLKRYPLIYITGGSQGSAFINNLIWNSLPQLTNFTLIHQLGKHQPPQSCSQFPNYIPKEYIGPDDIGWVFKHSVLVVSRAGANICQELAALNKRAIIIPHPFTQQNEQIENAKWLAAILPKQISVLPQNNRLSANKFVSEVKKMVQIPASKTSTDRFRSDPLQFVKLIYEVI